MSEKPELRFEGGRIAENYDEVMVPVLFEPWAEQLLGTLPPEPDWDVLDLATGTGVAASKLAARLGSAGSLTAADLSPDMLAVAERRVRAVAGDTPVRFALGPAHPLALKDASFDALYCQQGFQFFPDGGAAAAEMHRVLRPGGKVALSAWCPLSECDLFGSIADGLREIGEEEAAARMGAPFDHMPRATLEGHFRAAGFDGVSVERVERDLVFDGGIEHAHRFLDASPIGPVLRELSEEKSAVFRARFDAESEPRTRDGVTRGAMASLVLTAGR